MLNFLGLGGLLNYNTSIPHGDPRISPPPPPSNSTGSDSLSEFLINAQKDQPSSGLQILPPGSMSTADMGQSYGDYTGISTTERQFLEKHGKPFSEMTPEEQYAVQNPQPSEPRSMQDLISRNLPVNRNRQPAYQSSPFFNPMPPMYSNPYVSPFMGGLSMAPYMGGNFGMSGPFGSPMYGGRMGMMGMGLGGCPPTYGF